MARCRSIRPARNEHSDASETTSHRSPGTRQSHSHSATPSGRSGRLASIQSTPRIGHFRKAKAADQVIVHQTCRLHECITDCRADKLKAAALQIAAHGFSFGTPGRNLASLGPAVDDWPAINKPPKIRVQGAECLLYLQ